ncbi:branched-chain amino acid ABC transporter permease [Candidatus Bipolaricaulota bacterium]|nr:branched-chain amino acid ABC transporter permease [Candidatus Bipolaricaulota bacterium]
MNPLKKWRELRTWAPLRLAFLALFLAFLVSFPFWGSRYWVDVGFYVGLYALLGLGLNVILGEVGLFNLGHAAFWAIGAYATAILNARFGLPTLALLPVSALVAAGCAWIISSPIIHLRGDYLCIVTIALGEIVRLVLINNPGGLTGGPNGVVGIDRPVFLGHVIRTPMDFYFLVWALVALCAFGLRQLQRSRIGRAWNYIREDEIAAEAMGVDVRALKLLAFVLGAALAGIAGNIFAAKMRMVSPDSFTFLESCLMFCIVLLGGMGSIPGTILGAALVVLFPEILRPVAQYRLLFFGLALAATMYFRPGGLWPRRRAVEFLREAKS